MSRIFFSERSRVDYFRSIKTKSGLSWNLLAKEMGVSGRQFRDWVRGVYSFPESIANLIKEQFNLDIPQDVIFREDRWHMPKAASAGGKRRLELHGPPGTPEGRRKGGLNSFKTHSKRNTGFTVSKSIKVPNKSTKLAELVGAMLGDGSMSLWQARITLNLITDKEYSIYLSNVISELFGIKATLFERKSFSVIELIISSKKMVSFLKRNGILVGNKIKHGLDIPTWIYEHKRWQAACLRGLFDTDGCTYIDHHNYKGRRYGHIGLAYTSYSMPLSQSVYEMLVDLGYSPTLTTKRRVILRREREVIKFFNEIRPSNSRHEKKLNEFVEEYRSGHNGTVSKAVVAVRLP